MPQSKIASVQLACNPVQLAWRPPPYNPRAAARAARLHGAGALAQPLTGKETSVTAGIGRFDDGRVAETFLNAGEDGMRGAMPRDAVITLRHAVTREADASATGPRAAVLDILAGETGGTKS
jgi:ribonucleoside-diphosphate reductase alpha chain